MKVTFEVHLDNPESVSSLYAFLLSRLPGTDDVAPEAVHAEPVVDESPPVVKKSATKDKKATKKNTKAGAQAANSDDVSFDAEYKAPTSATRDDMVKAIQSLSKRRNVEFSKQLVEKIAGAKRLGDIPESKFGEVTAACEAN
jgi:hypothetical protein